MSEEEFNLGFADDRDDWGLGVDPKNLNTLRCLNSHLSAEEDYYKDPRRRPRFSFFADAKLIPPDTLQLNRELAAHDVRPEDMKRIEGHGLKKIGQIRKEGANSICKRLRLHSSMRYALQNMLDNLPDPGAWNRVSKGRKADPFRVRLNKNETDRMPPRWAEGNFSIEIEELERSWKQKNGQTKTRSFRVRISTFDIDAGVMTLRPDQWRPEQAKEWADLLDRINGPLHFREGADDYNTFRKSQAVGILIHEKTEQAKSLAQTIRDANVLPGYPRSMNQEKLLNPGLNLRSRMSAQDRRGVETQRLAVATGLSCPDISLIRGPPGTGKTTVICEIIQQLAVEQGLRILMVAPTHTAVDNVLERIGLLDGPNFLPGVYPLRHASNSNSVSSHLRMFTWGELSTGLRRRLGDTLEVGLQERIANDEINTIQKDWLQQLRQTTKGRDEDGEERQDIIGHMLKHNVNLVCATTIGISTGGKFEAEGIPFDIAIIDEASKATLGEFLVPGIRAKRWLLVGDEKQLSPHVDQAKIEFILARIIWKHFTWKSGGSKDGKRMGKSIWVAPLTNPHKEHVKGNHIREGVAVSEDGNELTGFFAMSPEIQGLFEKSANDVRISLEQWFEHRMSNNENLRRQHQWRVFSSVLNLRADLEDKLSVISYNAAVRKWEKEKEKIDDDFIRATSKWENECRNAKAQHEKELKVHEKSLQEIADYPAKLESAKQAHKSKEESRKEEHAQKVVEHELAIANWEEKPKKDRGPKPRSLSKFKEHKFTAPPKPKKVSHPRRYQDPKKPVKPAYPEKPNKRPKSWRRPPKNRPKIAQIRVNGKWINSMWDRDKRRDVPLREGWEPRKPAPHTSGAIKPWCYDQRVSDNLDRLWKDLVMVADFEYNSGFELLAERLSHNKKQDRIVTLNVQHRMHPQIAEFNSSVVYGDQYFSGSRMVDRGVATRLLGTPLKKEDSLVLLDTSLFGNEAMEQLDRGQRGKYVNVAEAKVIVEAIDDIARDLSSIPHPEDRYWEIAIISFYKAQANAIQRALRVSDIVEPSGWKFLDKKTKSVRIEVNVVDRFQGREADVVLLPMTRANDRGKLGFMTVLNRINVATSRGKHRLILVGNARKLQEMGEKYDERTREDDSDQSMTENAAPSNFVSQLLDYVQRHGKSLQVSPKDLKNDWSSIDLVQKAKNKRRGRKR
ncbi:MAG: AAA family ATPase [Euryarchaeota archaeon]|nr:AAA family ATPase [Euryarchaeota archaeon]